VRASREQAGSVSATQSSLAFEYIQSSTKLAYLNTIKPGEALRTVWYVERMAHAASCIYASMSLVVTVSAISNWAVLSMFIVLDELSLVLYSLVGSLLWLAYA